MPTYPYGGVVELANAVRAVEAGALGLADGRHDTLLFSRSRSDDVWNAVPQRYRC